MKSKAICCAGTSAACQYAMEALAQKGYSVTSQVHWDADELLLDVPSSRPNAALDTLLSSLPAHIRIWGGNLDIPALEPYPRVDLLKDEFYLARNAAITADCALKIAAPKLHTVWQETPVLIIGWGRIGKCLAQMLKGLDCPVSVAVRQEAQRACLISMGYGSADSSHFETDLSRFSMIINTVPEMVLPEGYGHFCPDCIKMDLASRKGIAGDDVIWARGLPGVHAPKSSGRLIAETMIRRMEETA